MHAGMGARHYKDIFRACHHCCLVDFGLVWLKAWSKWLDLVEKERDRDWKTEKINHLNINVIVLPNKQDKQQRYIWTGMD